MKNVVFGNEENLEEKIPDGRWEGRKGKATPEQKKILNRLLGIVFVPFGILYALLYFEVLGEEGSVYFDLENQNAQIIWGIVVGGFVFVFLAFAWTLVLLIRTKKKKQEITVPKKKTHGVNHLVLKKNGPFVGYVVEKYRLPVRYWALFLGLFFGMVLCVLWYFGLDWRAVLESEHWRMTYALGLFGGAVWLWVHVMHLKILKAKADQVHNLEKTIVQWPNLLFVFLMMYVMSGIMFLVQVFVIS